VNSRFDIASFFAARPTDHGTLSEDEFHRMISIEQRRAERSGKSFLLMLVKVKDHAIVRNNPLIVNEKVLSALSPITRETDVIGWYSEGTIVGLLFTEITLGELSSFTAVIMNRVSKELKAQLSAQQFGHVTLSFHLLPEALDHQLPPVATAPMVHPHVVSPTSVTESVLS
jgi:hypothetical protein